MTPPLATERVLSTLNQDGTRHWIHPRLAAGRFLRGRKVVGYALIAMFLVLPFVHVGGRPALLLDVLTQELSVFGAVFKATDGYLMMLLGLIIVVTVFLVTALFGRVWCGWACPQTVYLEHVFRPIERWLEGSPSQRRKLDAARGVHGRRVLKWLIYAALSFVLANVFLAYFVGVDRLATWVLVSPLQHPGGFMTVAGVAALMLFDFGYFREQTCNVACPYGRLQSVLLDRQSLIIGYDTRRGEPRGKPKKHLPVIGERGDCIDCSACVAVCPTGIDIREGLQMECIGCAQCIDACDAVMDRIAKPRKLIGYTSQDELEGKPRRLLRTRTILYPVLLAGVTGLFVWALGGETTQVHVERAQGPIFVELPDGMISSQARIKLDNETDEERSYAVHLSRAPDAKLRTPQVTWQVQGGRSMTLPLFVDVPRSSFVHGKRVVSLRVADDRGFARIVEVTLLGPEGAVP
ncbi:MAG: cytochrome c oxidase accessory protein CcoG [Deltaproteobacteria bacterium]|nr:cytochrome c oxidase accessory protein CcoG [Deltaproteobacteria bacterium]